MRRLRVLAMALVALLGASSLATAAGSVVLTSSSSGSTTYRYNFAWTSDAGGAVSGNPQAIAAGEIIQAQFIPGAGGTQPTDLYDATFLDVASVDLLQGSGANLSNATSKLPIFNPRYWHDGQATVDLVIANAGNVKTGTFVIWVRP